jgi:WD40 repeat protein
MVRLWNPATGQQIAYLSGHTGTVSTMVYEPKTQQLITGGFDTSVRFWTLPLAESPFAEQPLFPEIPMPLP